jgi:acetyl-CoA C-acetyltransferase
MLVLSGVHRVREVLTMLLRELDRRQARYGLESMCIGAGQGLSGLVERVGP